MKHLNTRCYTILFIIVCAFQFKTINAQVFVNRSEEMGVDYSANNFYGNGLSMYDWDSDGFDDLVLLRNQSQPLFLKNNNGIFTQVQLFVINENMDYQSVNWVDINNDGIPEISFHGREGTFLLYKKDGGNSFSNITVEAGINVPQSNGAGHSWGDYNNDGFLDLYVCNFENPFGLSTTENYLFRNNGDFTFTDVTSEAGVGNGVNLSFQSVWFDYDKDGLQDLYVINDRVALQNYLYRNMGDGTFQDVSEEANVNAFIDAMSATVGDYNNDGWLDIYVTNGPAGNILHKNNGDGTFTDVTGINNLSMFRFCWGAVWLDYDGDMMKDLYVGTLADFFPGEHYLFLNRGFQFDRDLNEGVDSDSTNGFASAVGDLNNDGYPDLVVHNGTPSKTELWINEGRTYNFLKIRLQGTITNRDAIGCWIEFYTNDTTQYFYTMAGEQYLAQNSQWKLLSTGRNDFVDSLKIRWLSGMVETYYSIPVNQTIVFIEGQPPLAEISIEENTLLCRGASVVLDGGFCSSYAWSTGEDTRFITVSEAGMYILTGINFLGDTISDTLTLEYLPQAIHEAIISPPSCFGSNDATVQLINVSDVLADSVSWNNGINSFFADSLSEGNYFINVFDEYGCIFEMEVNIPSPDLLITDISVLHAQLGDTCSSNWDLSANIQGGLPPYQYQWQFFTPGNTIPYFESQLESLECVSASNNTLITLILTDSNDCSVFLSEDLGTFVKNKTVNKSNIRIYPNPVNQFVQIEGLTKNSVLTIYDVQGKCVVNEKFTEDNKASIDIAHLSSGTYVMKILSTETQLVKSFVKY